MEKRTESYIMEGATPKYVIQERTPNREKMGKGVTLTTDEMQKLHKILSEIAED